MPKKDLDSLIRRGLHLDLDFMFDAYVDEELENFINKLTNCLLKINELLGGNITIANLSSHCLNILLTDPRLEYLALEKKVISLQINYYESSEWVNEEKDLTQQFLAKNKATLELLSKLEKMVNLKKIKLNISIKQSIKWRTFSYSR